MSYLGKSHKRTLLFLLACIEYMSVESEKNPAGVTIDIKSLRKTDINLDDINSVLRTTFN